jgi:hypothetical protein
VKTKLLVTFAILALTACPTTPKPHYVPAKDSDLLGAMCAHLKVLGCEEGQDVYDSDNPGPAGVPNTTCEAEYIKIQSNGTYLNPKCLLKVTSCGEIEEARKRTCE